MELAGDEKRIRALFSELALENQSAAPRFEKLWNRAQTTNSEPMRSRSFLVIATALVIAITGSVALWSRYRSVQSASYVNRKTESITESTTPRVREQIKVVSTGPGRLRRRGLKHLARQTKTETSLIQQAVILSSWQSPTEAFLQSPATPDFKSLPQLNQSVKELESFLPNNNVKESKP